ncbi:MAG: DNA methyltransferase, partial [Bacteroidales bacterium]|nr:DNA methyltransferase [Bacteroidales bacterium]
KKAGRIEVSKKSRQPKGKKPKTLWSDSKYSATTHGSKFLLDLLGSGLHFSYPKSIHLTTDAISSWADENAIVLDYFAGSGTTGHAVINLNREDNGNRKYILVEMGQYFTTALKPRIQKVIYSQEWENGKPKPDAEGNLNSISHCFKYLRLESYEDTLNNLIVKKPSTKQQSLLDVNTELKEDYMLSYCLDMETKDSASLLNLEQFADPFNYKLNIATGSAGATKPTKVDLVETFNYLLGLTVKQIDTIHGFKVVIGQNPQEESVLVIWRVLAEKDNTALEHFMEKQQYHPRKTVFDHIYVNGDHTLEGPKVKMTEIEFKRLMFDVQNV